MPRRYAVYYAPPPDSRWWHFGSHWLGRDAMSGERLRHFKVPGLSVREIEEITDEPRRYGFHATLKPPLVLAEGAAAAEFHQAVEAVAAGQRPFALGRLVLREIGGFLALVPEREPMELAALAASCVEQIDCLRARPGEDDLALRRSAGLTGRQDALLMRWGYPYVMEEWQFHVTLTGRLKGRLQDKQRQAVAAWLEMKLRELHHEELWMDALCVFEQPTERAPFLLTRRCRLGGDRNAADQVGPGQLIYLVGASGAGKDSLMAYARSRLSSRPVKFARRYVTRPAESGGEDHVAVLADVFGAMAAEGAFALQWRSNGHCYGIGTEIDQWLASGIDVVVNGSREYLEKARLRYPRLRLVWVRAAPATLRARLAARGREDGEAMERRLQRASQFSPPSDAIIITNDGSLTEAGDRLVGLLSGTT